MKFCVTCVHLLRGSTLALSTVLFILCTARSVIARPVDSPTTALAPTSEPTAYSETGLTQTEVPPANEQFEESEEETPASRDEGILEFLEGTAEVAGTFLDHVGAIFNIPKIKKERNNLISNELKDVLLEHASETNKAAVEDAEKMATYEQELFEERLDSMEREKANIADLYESEVKSLALEKLLKSALELEKMNSQAQSEFNTFIRSIMFDPDICKQPGVHQRYCQVIDDILEIYKNGAEQNWKLIQQHYEKSQGIAPFLSYELTNFLAEEVLEPESSTRPKSKNQSGRQSCSPEDLKGKAPQRDDDEDEMDGSNGSPSRFLPSTSTSQPGPSGSNSKDSSTAANGASGGPSGVSAADGVKYEIDDNILNFLLEDAIAWNPKQIAAPPLPLADKFGSLAPPRHDVPPLLITYHPLDAPAVGGLPLAVEA